MRIVLILAVIGLIETGQYLKGRTSMPLSSPRSWAASCSLRCSGWPALLTVRLFYKDGQWWTRGSWVTAILWVASVAAHLGFDYLVGGRGPGAGALATPRS